MSAIEVMRTEGALVARWLLAALVCVAAQQCLAAPTCAFDQSATTVAASSTDEVFVRANATSYRCTGLTPGIYYYFCAGAASVPVPVPGLVPRTAPAFRLLNLFGQPLAPGDLLRAFRADGASREESVPLFRLGIPSVSDAAAGTYAASAAPVVDVVEGGAVFSSREGCATGRRIASPQVALPLQIVLRAVCDVSLSAQLAFGRAPPSWDVVPDPAARLDLKCAAPLPWRASLDDGENATGGGPLRRHLKPGRLAYGVRAGVAGEAVFAGAAGDGAKASVPMRGHLPGNPRAEGLAGQTDTLVTTLDF